MTQIKINKSSLGKEQKKLKNYKQFLPSLELKRQKLRVEINKAQQALETLKKNRMLDEKMIGKQLPMVSNNEINIDALVTLESLQIDHENVVGIRLPVCTKINFVLTDYPYFNTPHWLDDFVHVLRKRVEMRIRLNIAKQRVQLLDKALQTVTQRKNLFEKILIPNTTRLVRFIQIFLADNERAAVVRSKIAKKKRLMK